MGESLRGQSIMSSRSVSEANTHKCFRENKLISLCLFYCSWFYDRVFHTVWKNTKNCRGTKNRKESVLRNISPLDFVAVFTRCTRSRFQQEPHQGPCAHSNTQSLKRGLEYKTHLYYLPGKVVRIHFQFFQLLTLKKGDVKSKIHCT